MWDTGAMGTLWKSEWVTQPDGTRRWKMPMDDNHEDVGLENAYEIEKSVYNHEQSEFYALLHYKDLRSIASTKVAESDGRHFAKACKTYKRMSARWLRYMLVYFDVQDKFGFYNPTEI